MVVKKAHAISSHCLIFARDPICLHVTVKSIPRHSK